MPHLTDRVLGFGVFLIILSAGCTLVALIATIASYVVGDVPRAIFWLLVTIVCHRWAGGALDRVGKSLN